MSATAKIAPGAVVCQDAKLIGDVRIGAGTVVHPRCEINAAAGPIVIGEHNVIEECVVIRSSTPEGIKIGSNNIFEVGAQVLCPVVGDANVIEARATLAPSASVGDGCAVTAKLTLDSALPSDTVLFGATMSRRTAASAREPHMALHAKHVEILAKTLPAHHPQAK